MKLKIVFAFILLSIFAVIVYSNAISKIEHALPENTKEINENDSAMANSETSNVDDFPKHIEEISQKFKTKNDENISIVLTTQKKKELEGNINKEYGIREDILRYIEKEIPKDNKKAFDAAIKLAAKSHDIYFKANKEEAIKLMNQASISTYCFLDSMPDNSGHEIYKNIFKLMRNSPDRNQYMWKIDKEYFGWKVLGFGDFSKSQLDKMCDDGNY